MNRREFVAKLLGAAALAAVPGASPASAAIEFPREDAPWWGTCRSCWISHNGIALFYGINFRPQHQGFLDRVIDSHRAVDFGYCSFEGLVLDFSSPRSAKDVTFDTIELRSSVLYCPCGLRLGIDPRATRHEYGGPTELRLTTIDFNAQFFPRGPVVVGLDDIPHMRPAEPASQWGGLAHG